MSNENFILLTDSYKIGHWLMFPGGTDNVYSYFESRKGAKYSYTVFFGLQMLLKRYFEGVVVTQKDIEEADIICKAHFSGLDLLNRKMWEKIVNVHGGKLPLEIKAVPEGTPVPVGNVLVTVQVTDSDCAPLTNVIETILTHLWASSNVATISRDIKIFMRDMFERTADTNNLLPFMLHDFGFRGVSSIESAGMGGAGHLLNFMGTDTMIALVYAQRYYGVKGDKPAGYSVPASEHSIMTSLGEKGEVEMTRSLCKKFPKGILSVVSDSYSIEQAVHNYGTVLKNDILARDGKFVVRPDSPRFEQDFASDQIVWIAQELENHFGVTINTKGYKVLHPKVGIIYGDGLRVEEIKESVIALKKAGFSVETCVFGMGGGLLQKHNRDTQRSAFKCSAQHRNGEWIDVQKKPLDITKASKKGLLKLVRDQIVGFLTVPIADPREDVLQTVFLNGKVVKEYTWDEVKENAK